MKKCSVGQLADNELVARILIQAKLPNLDLKGKGALTNSKSAR